MPKLRKMTWALLVWSGLFAAWIISAIAGADCEGTAAERAGCEAGTGIGVFLILILWFMGFVVLSLIWFMTRPREPR